MEQTKPIFNLPVLNEHQEWGCEQGCSYVKPRLFRHVYSQRWDLDGNLVEELAEHYYTCGNNHLLTVYDNQAGDFIELPEQHYKEKPIENHA